jgi:hypothetical protein
MKAKRPFYADKMVKGASFEAATSLFSTLRKNYGRSLAEIVGSNPTGGMDVCLL